MSDFVTDFEWAELVFVPAGGDGEPAQWKTRGDLTADEFGRYAQGRADDADLQMKRALRYRELVDEYLEVGLDVPISLLLDDEGMAEFNALERTLAAQEREQDRRQAAIERDMAAGRFRAWFSKTGCREFRLRQACSCAR